MTEQANEQSITICYRLSPYGELLIYFKNSITVVQWRAVVKHFGQGLTDSISILYDI